MNQFDLWGYSKGTVIKYDKSIQLSHTQSSAN